MDSKKTLGYLVGAAVVIGGAYLLYQWGDFGYEECNGQQCKIALEAVASGPSCSDKKAKPHRIKVTTKGADVYWQFADGSPFRFCGTDAPKFKDPAEEALYGSQFTNRCKTDSLTGPCPASPPECSLYYHWTSVGDIVKKVEYEVTFTTNPPTSAKCLIDPWFKNG
jgi:hypothetical protein